MIALIVFAFIYPVIFKKATCLDEKQNGEETGIDCGGTCARICESEITEPVILWSRFFPVVGTNYNLVAFVENRNKGGAVYNAQYEFRIYDVNNKLIGRRQGSTFVPPNQQFAIFESRFDSGQSQIKSVSFEFLAPLIWVKKAPTVQLLPIHTENIVLDNNENTPTLSASVVNDSIYDLPEFDVIAILYDDIGNAINASKTHKTKLKSGDILPVVFTWPEKLSSIPATKDILISINPFSVSF